jgi:hypothetical protein
MFKVPLSFTLSLIRMIQHYQCQYLDPFGKWKDLDGEIAETVDDAWKMTKHWERHCPSDTFRWIKKQYAV